MLSFLPSCGENETTQAQRVTTAYPNTLTVLMSAALSVMFCSTIRVCWHVFRRVILVDSPIWIKTHIELCDPSCFSPFIWGPKIFWSPPFENHYLRDGQLSCNAFFCEILLEKEIATHSSILAWRIPRTEEPGGLQFMGSQRVGHDWATSLHFTLVLKSCF